MRMTHDTLARENQSPSLLLLVVALGAVAYTLLFRGEATGVNLSLLALLLLGGGWFFLPAMRRSRPAQASAAGTLLAAVMVVYNDSSLARWAFILSWLTWLGFAHHERAWNHLIALTQGLIHFFFSPLKALQTFRLALGRLPGMRRLGYRLRLAIIPLAIVALFFVVYVAANADFARLSARFVDRVVALFSFELDWELAGYLIFGTMLFGAVVLPLGRSLEWTGSPFAERLERRRPQSPRHFPLAGLREEYQIALWTLAGLNLLLLCVNLVDVRHVWFAFDPEQVPNLKQYVHAGTGLLIVALLMAMAVLLWIFRGNLNFYPDGGLLRKMAYFWLAQNAVLALSTGLRTLRYIHWHGLAYKRLAVLVFLALVLFGLWSFYRKIRLRKTVAWLMHRNGWAFYWVVIACTLINWDVWITQYNLTTRTRGPIDVAFLLHTVSDKNYHVLRQHEARLAEVAAWPEVTPDEIARALDKKRQRIIDRARHSWLSWNRPWWTNWTYIQRHEPESIPLE